MFDSFCPSPYSLYSGTGDCADALASYGYYQAACQKQAAMCSRSQIGEGGTRNIGSYEVWH